MKRSSSGDVLANDVALDLKALFETFRKCNEIVRTKKDPFGKKVSPPFFFLLPFQPTLPPHPSLVCPSYLLQVLANVGPFC